jgi:hypothetical protein
VFHLPAPMRLIIAKYELDRNMNPVIECRTMQNRPGRQFWFGCCPKVTHRLPLCRNATEDVAASSRAKTGIVVMAGRKSPGPGCTMQRLRRAFAEYLPVFDRKAPQLDEAKIGRNLCHSCLFAIRGQKGSSRPRQPQHSKMPARRNAMDLVKCLAKRSLTYREGTTKS